MAKQFEVKPTDDTIKNQTIAGDPSKSIWVSANAGSGKTHILTQRVLRILLSGVAPENILCLTYTKAAAAEMTLRVSDSLSEWSMLDDKGLSALLTNISGHAPSAEQVLRARALFALALETPGGLKISTIHAFCEAALHRFPLEADVPVNFSVIEDLERMLLIKKATDQVLAIGLNGDKDVGEAVANLFDLMSDESIGKAIASALGQGNELREILDDPNTAKANLRNLVKYNPQRLSKSIREEVLSQTSLLTSDCTELVGLLSGDPDKTRGVRFVDVLARMDPKNIDAKGLITAFVTGEGNPRATIMPKPVAKKYPEIFSLFENERDRVFKLFAELRATDIVVRSEALLVVMGAIHTRYENFKAARDKLDFDDLITKFEHLLTHKTSSDWVRYKLDAGMTHVLVDESQDTNPGQWRVIKLLVDDFFSGESSAQLSRTVFGVGDEKQSIFGFQGAKPALFGETGSELRLKADNAQQSWENVRFPASFRTLENILEGVDQVCARTDIRAALLSQDFGVAHESARTDSGGSITLWPLPEKDDTGEPSDEWLEHPAPSTKTGQRKNAERIVAQIKHWIDTKRPLGARGRPVCANDILILVQTRHKGFHEIIRALKNANIPTPGADKLLVSQHIMVHDLLALGDVLLNQQDDLSLACVLVSPLFNVSLEQLEEICQPRPKGVSVWRALGEAAPSKAWAKSAYELLTNLRKNLNRDRPYEFFAELLFSHGGLKKFHRRLGEEIDEIVDLFLDLALDHEQSPQPSLQGFLADLRSQDISIKRELSEGGSGVRVMSVHGAKGLEAPIVILADANKKPQLKQSVFIQNGPTPLFVHGTKETHTPETLEHLRDPAEFLEGQEYWRKLYVAMTRAEDELYISGFAPLRTTDLKLADQPSWYGAISQALEGQMVATNLAGETETGMRFPVNLPPAVPIADNEPDQTIQKLPSPILPIEFPTPLQTIRPSTAFEGESTLDRSDPSPKTGDAELARLRGKELHKLLEHLVPIAPDLRKTVALSALTHLLSAQPDHHELLAQKAVDILGGPHGDQLFGANSRAELPIFVFGEKNNRPVQIIGRIDRLVATGDTILLVDFKSNAAPPTEAHLLSQAYKTQMGLYLRCARKLFPALKVSTAIFWTSNENLMALDNDLLLEATRQFNIT